MILHHSSGKSRLLKRIFSMCIALLMVCTFSSPAFATDQAIIETDAPPGITYNFYSGGELYSSQTVKDEETLTEPTAPTAAGKIFEGWFTSEDETAQKFEAFGPVSVTEKTAVDLYAKWTGMPANVCDELKEPSVNLLAGNGNIPEDDENFIIVEKKFVGIKEDQIPQNFSITVAPEGGSGVEYVLTQANCSATVKEADGTIIWRWKITKIGTGTYKVAEENQSILNYIVATDGEGSVTVKKADIKIEVPKEETSCRNTEWPVSMDGRQNVMFAASLTQNCSAVISRYPLPASQRAAVEDFIDGRKGPWKTPVYFYSVEEQKISGKGFELNGATITYDASSSKVKIGAKCDWNRVMTLEYSVSEANNPEIGITNTYKPSPQDITIKKIVTGPLGDIKKEFQFTYAYTGADGTPINGTYPLQNGETATITGVPIGTKLVLKETNASGYATTASYGELPVSVSGEKEDSEKTMTITITEGNKLIEVTNHKDVIPDTGIRLESLPYILIFAIVIAGMTVLIVRKCKRRNF